MPPSHSQRTILFLEAVASLVSARLAVALLPFPALVKLTTRHGLQPDDRQNRRETLHLVRRSIRQAATAPLVHAVCLPQAMAANWMLGRRGIESRVCLGVRRDPESGKMAAHAWLRVGDEILLGGTNARHFAKVAELPLSRANT